MKKHYIIYDIKTGQILRHGVDEESHVVKKAKNDGVLFLDNQVENTNVLKVVDGQLVEKTELEITSERLEKENERALKREQGLTKLRTSVSYELSVVDPNVISLLKKLQVIPQDL